MIVTKDTDYISMRYMQMTKNHSFEQIAQPQAHNTKPQAAPIHGDREQAVKSFLREFMNKAKDEQTLSSILQHMGSYYDADRAYIFEANEERTSFSNTFEWCREGVAPEIENLQNIPVDGMECWFEAFNDEGEFYITSLSDDYHPGTKTYEILEPQGINSLMAAPITVGGEVVGFLGVDNPRERTDELLLLSVAASTCYSDLTTERQMRERMLETNQALMERVKIIQSLGEIYTSMYYISLNTGRFMELSSIDKVSAHIGTEGDAQDRLNHFCRHMAASSCCDELLDFVDLSTLRDRLKDTRVVTKEYQSTLFAGENEDLTWRECSFIEADRDESGQLSRIIFTTRLILTQTRLPSTVRRRKREERSETTSCTTTTAGPGVSRHTPRSSSRMQAARNSSKSCRFSTSRRTARSIPSSMSSIPRKESDICRRGFPLFMTKAAASWPLSAHEAWTI